MNSKDYFEVGGKYKERGDSTTVFTFVGFIKTPNETVGEFEYNNRTHQFSLCYMTRIKPEFEFDEEIEVSFNESFKNPYTARFICETDGLSVNHREDKYLVITEYGVVCSYDYARKIEPKVMIKIPAMYCDHEYQIPKSLADKIKAGDV